MNKSESGTRLRELRSAATSARSAYWDVTPRRRRRTLAWLMVAIAIVMVPLNLAVGAMRVFGGWPEDHPIVRLINVNDEANIPTILTGLLLVFASSCAVWAGKSHSARWRWNWWFAAAVLLFLAYDEVFKSHEGWGRALGWDSFAWVIPALGLAVLVGAISVPWLRSLPPLVRVLVFSSGAVYVGSAAGMEIISSRFLDEEGRGTAANGLLGIIEELGEASGVALFCLASFVHVAIMTSTSPRAADGLGALRR